ncbi:GNAT family N-acetyltransferase [Roseivirga sp. E12]|uniref:GNAT family N-acetyltransferase n=1 Tax=Roseivirga sp. E12 TaxID=2819237 RepID=UPI001ABCAABC|nr:GNAT family N-acetyltransferase [Roseivirga sp. E12]MBO3696912.1 N-acetyltransferase [Roseivirga sp. E12]
MSSINIRFVHSSDAQDLLKIYASIVLETATSFETEVPTVSTFTERIKIYSEKSPWLVAEVNDQIVGYAYGTSHRSRQAYQWNQEVTVYVHPDFKRRGIARLLYTKLLDLLKEMGFRKALAVITLPNDPSVEFHKSLGFKHIGEMKGIGFKLGKWHNTSWWDLDLGDNSAEPLEIKPITSIEHLL